MEELFHHFKKWERLRTSSVWTLHNTENGFYFSDRYKKNQKEYTIDHSLSHALSKRLDQDVLVIMKENTRQNHVIIKNQGLFGGFTFYKSKDSVIRYYSCFFVNEGIPQSLEKARDEFPFSSLLNALKEELERLPEYRLLAATGMLTYRTI